MKGIILISLIGVLLFLPSCVGVPPTEPYRDVIKISAAQLISEYEANEVAADLKYEDRALEVTGIIIDIGKELLGHPYVILGTGKKYEITGVQAIIPDEQDVAKLSIGHRIAVRGICNGKFILNVILDSCYRVKVE